MNFTFTLRHFRKRLFALLAVMCCFVVVVASDKVGDLYYDFDTNNLTATVTYESTASSNYSSLTSVTIPSTVQFNSVDYKVTAIGASAFRYCSSLESLTIPASVTEIGHSAFNGCTGLKNLRFDDGVETLNLGYKPYSSSEVYGLFKDCALETLYLGRNIDYIDYSSSYPFDSYPSRYGYSAFYDQFNLSSVIIGDNVTTLPKYLFYQCEGLTSIDLGNALTIIPDYFCRGCSSLQSIDIPNTVKSIGAYAFYGAKSLADLTMGSSITSIGDYAFYGTTALTDITLPGTLTEIGSYAFYNSGLVSVDIPNAVTSLGDYAFSHSSITSATIGVGVALLPTYLFSDCDQLKEVVIGSGVTEIDSYVFSNCTSLASVTIGANVGSIGLRTFSGCSSLESLTIPASVTEIGHYAFNGCAGLKNLRFEDGLETLNLGYNNYSSSGTGSGLFKDCALETLYLGRNIDYLDYNSSYSFDSYPSRYGYSAFYDQPSLANVTIGASVTELSAYLFYKNTAIASTNLPSVIRIGDHCFDGCSKLSVLTFGNNLEAIGDYAFNNCTNLTNLSFPDATTNIGNYAFYNCQSVTQISIGANMTTVGNSAFQNCIALTAARFPDALSTLGTSAFEGCKKLTYVTLGANLTAIQARTFRDCIVLSEMVVPDKVTSIGDYAFYNCSGIASMKLSAMLKTIGAQVFYNNSFVNLEIPGTVEQMGSDCFHGCTRLMYLTFQDGDGTLKISNSGSTSSQTDYSCEYDYFYDCPIRVLYIGKNLEYSYSSSKSIYDLEAGTRKSRASAPFAYKTSIRSVTIGPKVTVMYNHLLNGCSGITELTMPDGLQKVNSDALANCTGLTELTFPGSLTFLGSSAVQGSTAISSVTFKDGEPELTIGSYGFADCPLTELYIGKTITYSASNEYSPFKNKSSLATVTFSHSGTVRAIHDNLLWGVSGIQSLDLPESIMSIGPSAFREMTALASVTLPSQIPLVASYLFYNDVALPSIVIPDNVTTVDQCAFSKCSALQQVKIGSSVATINNNAFDGCSTLSSLEIPANVKTIGNDVFARCSALADLTLADGTEYLNLGYCTSQSRGLFRDCPLVKLHIGRWVMYQDNSDKYSPFAFITTLNELTIGETVQLIGKYAFKGCTGIENLYVPDGVGTIALEAFYGCSGLKSLRLSNNLISLAERAFASCTSLPEVTLPASLEAISEESFADCSSLVRADLGETLLTIGPRAFANCVKLEKADIPETVYGLGVESFSGCVSLPYAVVPGGISSVGSKAFAGCTSIGWVSLSEKVTSIGEDAFAGITGIKYIKSYNTIPPEGLPGFEQNVKDEATLFIPAESMDYYKYSPTWEEFLNIRALSDDVFVTDVTISQTEAKLKDTETLQLKATVTPADATNLSVIWKSSNEEVAIVDQTGLVTAVGVGSVDISAVAADGSGVAGVCAVTVEPMLVASLTVEPAEVSVKENRSVQLSATITPVTATTPEVVWKSSNDEIATVDESGNVNAISEGSVVITAEATDGSGVVGQCSVTVLPTLKGDSNDNDEVTVTDAVNTANYAIGKEVTAFYFKAADVNSDNQVTMADASGTISIVLEQPVAAGTMLYAMPRANSSVMDCLVMDDFTLKPGKAATVFISLDNMVDYVALQADITLPESMTLESVKKGLRADANHSLFVHRLGGNVVRVVLFAANNSAFTDAEGAIIELVVKSDNPDCGSIEMSNIIASDADANEYHLTSIGGHNASATSISGVDEGGIGVASGNGGVSFMNAEGKHIYIYSLDGSLVASFVAASSDEFQALVGGVYIVRIGEMVKKVLVE